MIHCFQCPDDHHPTKDQDTCIPKDIIFLSFEEPLGATLASFAGFLSFTTIVVLGIFMKHHETPIVKANNRNLSYTLLTALLIYFLSSFLFIGRPTKLACLLQPTFQIDFSVALSCLLAKNAMVVLAFRAKKPGSQLQKCLGKKMAISVLLSCSLTQSTICALWILCCPPFPDLDVHSMGEKALLMCNVGSSTLAFCILSFQAFLSILSLTVAFLARKLPGSFNEAKFIVFSMLAFSSIWLCYIPTFFGIKGKSFVVVEVFSILGSGAALLGFIFSPKCYVIVFRPDLNKREQLVMSKDLQGFQDIIA